MSDALYALVAALAGALLTFFTSYFGRLRGEYAARVGSMEVIKSDLQSARDLIDTALDRQEVWQAQYRLSPVGWESHRADLVSRLKPATWKALRHAVVQLQIGDAWAEERRSKGWTTPFETNLKKRRVEVESSINELDRAMARAQLLHRSGLTAGCAGLIAMVVGLVLIFSTGQALTGESLAEDIRAQIPGAGRTICDENAEVEGGFLCTVDVSACGGRIEASTDGPSCPAQRGLYEATSEDDCFAATLSRTASNGNTNLKPTAWWRRFIVLSGCDRS